MTPNRLTPRLLALLAAATTGLLVAAAIVPPTVQAQISQNVELLAHVDEDGGYNDCWGYTAPNGDEYAIIGTQSGTAFYNVTVPTAPVRVGFIDGPNSTWRDMKTWGDHCYIVTESDSPASQRGLQIVDLSNPETPTLANTVQGDFDTAHNIFIDTGAGRAYVVGTNTAGGGMVIYDLTQSATNPPMIGTYTNRYVHDVYVKNGIAYVAAIFDGRSVIVDVSNPANPFEIHDWTYPGAMTHNTWTSADQTLLVTTDETGGGHLNFWDITTPTAPTLLDDYTANASASAHNAFIRNTICYVSYYTEGLRVIDITNPSAVQEVGWYDTFQGGGLFNGAWGCYPFAQDEGIVYISDMSGGLFVVDFNANFGTLQGTVADINTQLPIDGATVVIVETGQSRTTDASGFYAIALDPGSYTVEVSAFGYEPASQPAGVTAGQVTTLDFDLTPVASGGLAGFISSPADAPIADAEVSIEGTPLTTTSDAAGAYSFPQVPIGDYAVNVQRFRYAPASQQATINAGQQTDLDFTLLDAFFWTEMETDPGWTPSGTATTGHWVRVDPNGTSGGSVQPEDDHTADPAVMCWVTGQGSVGGSIGENDVDNGIVVLTTQVFDLTGVEDPTLQYYRWYSNDAGGNPGEDPWVVEASSNGGTSWVVLEQTFATENFWKLIEKRLLDILSEPLDQVQFRFTAQDLPGSGSIVEAAVDDFQIFDAGTGQTGIELPAAAPAHAFRLRGNAPNPFNPSTNIHFELPAAGTVSLRIYDAAGRLARSLIDGGLDAGSHAIAWDGRLESGRPAASGVYFYRLEADGRTATRRMVLAK